MEYLDIVNDFNEYTGEVVERSLAHKKNLAHRHVSCWMINELGEILMQKRAETVEKNPGEWGKTGGHVDSKETMIDALKREAKEEIGLDLNENDVKLIHIFKSDDPNNKYFSYTYIVKINKKIKDFILQEEEVSEVRYFKLDELIKARENKNPEFTFNLWNDDEFNFHIEKLKNYINDM